MHMTVPMDNIKENPSRSRAQHLFSNNLDLEKKRRNAAQARIQLDPNVWQTMRENYEAIILEDHAFSEQHDVEYALWQLHYRRIEQLRVLLNSASTSSISSEPSNGKGPLKSGPDRGPKIRSQFKSFLSEATGFYHDLMLKIRAKYGLPLGYFSDDPENHIATSKNGNKSSEVKKGLISCHRCLIYLGDLARYKCLYGEGNPKARDFSAASSYYMQASSIWSSSGNPHHQLAILAGYSNDELVTVYRYFRSLATKNPCATASDNLIIAFEKNRQTYNHLVGEVKDTTSNVPSATLEAKGTSLIKSRTPLNKVEGVTFKGSSSNLLELLKSFTTRFIRLNGILFTRTSLEVFAELQLALKDDFLSLLSFGPNEEFNFGSDAAECALVIIRMTAILIFNIRNASRDKENQSYADILQRSVLLQNAFTATFEFTGYILERCNQLKDPSRSFLLPGIVIFVEWLACHQNVTADAEVQEKQASARSFFWSECVCFLNKLLSTGFILVDDGEDESCFNNMSKYDESETSNRLALPEDFELRGFVPLLPAQRVLDFSRKRFFSSDGDTKDGISRVQRIFAAGKALANAAHSGKERFYFDSKLKKFMFGSEPMTFDDSPVVNHFEHDPSGGLLDISNDDQMGISAPKTSIDTDEEDEVIVFKPFTGEKTLDEMASSGNHSTVAENGKVDYSTYDQPSLMNGVANGTFQNLPPIQPSILRDNSTIVSGFGSLKVENGPVQMQDLQGVYGISKPAAVSMAQLSISESFHGPSPHTIQTHLPFEPIMPSGASVVPPGLKKNPVSRPVRHIGPPPGFGSVAPKDVDDPLRDSASRNGYPTVPALDDYRWLDGYQMSSSNHSSVNRSVQMEPAFASMNQFGPAIPSVRHVGPISSFISKLNGSIMAETLPVTGSTSNLSSEYRKHQFQNDNEQMLDPSQPYHGNPRFLV